LSFYRSGYLRVVQAVSRRPCGKLRIILPLFLSACDAE
jgi:hypothetical protein